MVFTGHYMQVSAFDIGILYVIRVILGFVIPDALAYLIVPVRGRLPVYIELVLEYYLISWDLQVTGLVPFQGFKFDRRRERQAFSPFDRSKSGKYIGSPPLESCYDQFEAFIFCLGVDLFQGLHSYGSLCCPTVNDRITSIEG